MNRLLFYPTYNDSYQSKIKLDISNSFQLEYRDGSNGRRTINAKHERNYTILVDQNHMWTSEFNDLLILNKVKLDSTALFGENGIAPYNSKIGVATSFSSIKSSQRGINKNIILDKDSGEVEFYLEYHFGPNYLRSEFDISLILYLDTPATELLLNEENLNNTQGVNLGELYTRKFLMDGDGSTFPTETVKVPGGPLWSLRTGFHVEDPVSESLLLMINESHKDFDLINFQKKEKYDKELIKEISISMVYQIIVKHRDEYINYKDEFSHNSVGSLIKYYVTVYNIDLSDPDKIFEAISKGIRK